MAIGNMQNAMYCLVEQVGSITIQPNANASSNVDLDLTPYLDDYWYLGPVVTSNGGLTNCIIWARYAGHPDSSNPNKIRTQVLGHSFSTTVITNNDVRIKQLFARNPLY